MPKEFWDFDENMNYKTVSIHGNNYKVLNNYHDYYTAAFTLDLIHKIITLICKYFQVNFYKYSKTDQLYISCFLDIHPNKYLLSEMQLGTMFNGLNKPRDLYLSNKPSLGKDGKYRAKFRHVFLTLRNSNGKFNDFDTIMDLVIHEIAHTMCNHIRWRDDDHGKDFKHAEKLIKNAYKKVISNNSIL
jgi:hypothetical protein